MILPARLRLFLMAWTIGWIVELFGAWLIQQRLEIVAQDGQFLLKFSNAE